MNQSIGDILKDVAELHKNVTVRDIRGGSRTREIVAARHAAIWVLRQATDMSLETIAAAVGLTDHTTASYAIKKLTARVAMGDTYAAKLRAIVQTYATTAHVSLVDWADPPQKLPGSPDRWAIWNLRHAGGGPVNAA